MTSKATGLFVTIVIVGVLISAIVFETQIGGPTSSTITTTQTSVNSSEGLQLSLGVDVRSNGSLQIRVSELNTLSTSKNISKADSWRVQGLSLGSCPAGVYPFGIAV